MEAIFLTLTSSESVVGTLTGISIVLLLGAAGLPIPSSLVVMAAGAAARERDGALSAALALNLAAVLVGDASSYLLGRAAGGWVSRFVMRRSAGAWERAQKRFARGGSWTVFLSRFLITPLDVPVNLIARSERFPLPRFLSLAAVGRLAWLLLYGGLGFVLGSHWSMAARAIQDYCGPVAAVVLGLWGVLRLVHRLRTRTPRVDIIPMCSRPVRSHGSSRASKTGQP